jgi:hypothetical protein
MKIHDKLFRDSNIARHPDFEPYLAFNDKPGSPTIYFKSTYNKSFLAAQLHKQSPLLYYWPEKKENETIIIKRGSFARIPHAFFTVHSTDNSPVTYSVRSEKNL